jgi:hypothetical protein
MGNRRRLAIGAAFLFAMLTTALGSLGLASAGDTSTGSSNGPIVGEAESYGVSPAVRDLAPAARGGATTLAPSRINPLTGEPGGGGGAGERAGAPADPLFGGPGVPGRTPARDLVFNGTSNPFACGGCSPPDTIGDVGPNHYIQMVNATKVAIHNKAGALLAPRFDLGDLWTSGPCTGNAGDPVPAYDERANRWLLSQFATPRHLCFAVSRTPNPLGAYHLFTFNVGAFPDYFKVGVWRDAYYVSANESTYTAYAFNRSMMLAGNPGANFIKFTGETNLLLPADIDGPTLPPGGGGLFYTFKDNAFHGGGGDRIELFRLRPDFTAPANSTFARVKTFPVTPFTYTVCGFFNFNCIPQRGTAQRVDAVSEWPMHRFAYRRFTNRQSLVGNFTIDVGSDRAGIRWFELRNTGTAVGGWTLFQQGTHAPGNIHRFMGSIAIDERGNIALGYSASSTTMFPAVRYATRERTDPLGTLEPERTLRAGGGSQTGSNRWGDYSGMSVDPVTDCQFWHTNQFYNPSSASNWKTVVGAFTMPGCT